MVSDGLEAGPWAELGRGRGSEAELRAPGGAWGRSCRWGQEAGLGGGWSSALGVELGGRGKGPSLGQERGVHRERGGAYAKARSTRKPPLGMLEGAGLRDRAG